MPLQKTCSIAAFEANIATEIKAGRDRVQAVAIATRTLRDACDTEGKPVPTRKAARERTREYLDAVLERARRILNPRDFAVIFQYARGSAGGKISAQRRRERMTALESHTVEKRALTDMSAAELKTMAHTLNVTHARNQRMGKARSGVLAKARGVAAEMKRRGMEPKGDVFKVKTEKGFAHGHADGGFHAHGLDRMTAKTHDDGAHSHAWVLPGTGEIISSCEDGWHQHALSGDQTTGSASLHAHKVPILDGREVETGLGGTHKHALMIETTGLDGGHVHELALPDGTLITSLTPAELVERMGTLIPVSTHLPSAHALVGAWRELERVQQEQALEDAAGAALPATLPSLDEAVTMAHDGAALDAPVIVIEAAEDTAEALGAEPGDLVDLRAGGEVIGFSRRTEPDSEEDVSKALTHWRMLKRHTARVPFAGPEEAPLVFVAAAPNELELARREAIVGEDALTFGDLYLAPLGLKKSDVASGFAMPVLPYRDLEAAHVIEWGDHLAQGLAAYPHAQVVALGRVAREVLKAANIKHWSLPHPSAVRKKGDSGEVARKTRAIAKTLDGIHRSEDNGDTNRTARPSSGHGSGNLADAISESRKTGRLACKVTKSADEKQIVYGVVLDPYRVDLQNEWVPPAEIESTAHGFLKKSRIIGFEHRERADAQIVESWVEPYPSPADYKAALENQPHRVFARKFGDDMIHSGSWMAGVQLGDREWQEFKEGKLNAFSVGGFSFKAKVTTAAMPAVEIIELVESPA